MKERKIIENDSYSEEEEDKKFMLLESSLLLLKVKQHKFLFMHNLLPMEKLKIKIEDKERPVSQIFLIRKIIDFSEIFFSFLTLAFKFLST